MYEYEVIGSLVGLVALYHLFGCGNPLSLFMPQTSNDRQSDASSQVAAQTGRISQKAQGQTAAEEKAIRDQIAPVIDYLQQQGMDADHAQVIQQAIANLSGQDLSQAYEQLKGFGDSVQQGIVHPGDVSTMGGVIATAVQKHYQAGQAFDFGSMMSEITNQMQAQMPQLMQTAQQASGVASDITARTGALGKLDANKFNERFDPALQRLNQAYTENSRKLSEQMDARGLQEQGSFASGLTTDAQGNQVNNPRIASESSPENHARLLLEQQHDQDLKNATLEAQAQTEGQQVAELGAAQQTPGALGEAVKTQASPFAALSNQTQAEANTNLALQSSRGADTKMLADTGQQAAATSVAGQAGATGAQKDILATDVARTQQTLPTALAQKAVPQTERLGYGAQVTPGVSGAFANLGSSAIDAKQRADQAAGGAFKSLVGAGIGALAAG